MIDINDKRCQKYLKHVIITSLFVFVRDQKRRTNKRISSLSLRIFANKHEQIIVRNSFVFVRLIRVCWTPQICLLGWSLKKVVYLQVEIERYGGKISFPVQKILNNARLQKDHFGQKMTPANTQQDIFGSQTHIFQILSNKKILPNTLNCLQLLFLFSLTIFFCM